jgi:hypothetical protein
MPGNGRGNRCETEQEMTARLDEDAVQYDPADLPAAVSRLEESARLKRPVERGRQNQERPYVRNGMRPYSDVDRLAVNIVACFRKPGRNERAESEDEATAVA